MDSYSADCYHLHMDGGKARFDWHLIELILTHWRDTGCRADASGLYLGLVYGMKITSDINAIFKNDNGK